jgi:hypothetical protein
LKWRLKKGYGCLDHGTTSNGRAGGIHGDGKTLLIFSTQELVIENLARTESISFPHYLLAANDGI